MNFAFSSTHKNSLLLKNNKLICLKITGEICIRNVILQTAGLNTPKSQKRAGLQMMKLQSLDMFFGIWPAKSRAICKESGSEIQLCCQNCK